MLPISCRRRLRPDSSTRYRRATRNAPCPARTLGGARADRFAGGLADTAVRDVAGEVTERRPVVRADATVAECTETMSRQRCALAMVEQRKTGVLGVGTAGRLPEVLVDAAVGEPPR